jgi:heterodisulfide reductase subunit A
MEPEPRIGVYVCHCGTNIAANVDVEQVAEFAATLPNVVVARDYLYMCSDPGQALIRQDIKERDLNRVVVASCSPLNRVVVASCSPTMHEPTFRGVTRDGGINPYFLQMANVREQCSWVHTNREEATEKAKALVTSAVAKAALLEPLEEREVGVTPGAVVIGGGVANLNRVFPTLESVAELLGPLIERVQDHPNVTVLLNAQVTGVEGYVGNFEVTVKSRRVNEERVNGERGVSSSTPSSSTSFTLDVGAIIVATGYDVFDPHRKPELGYGQYPNVITSLEMERRLATEDLTGFPKPVRSSVAFIQCVGSRDAQVGNPYCSRVCCMYTAKQARLVRELVVLVAEDTLLHHPIEFEADLVVLAVGMEPRSDVSVLSSLLKLPRSSDGFFMESHPKLRPVDTVVDGVFLAGCCQGPKDIPDTVAQAKAAASSALIPLIRGTVPVESATAVVDVEECAGCGMCVDVCPYGAPALDPFWSVSRINAVLCKGCGACASACSSKAIRLRHFTPKQVLAQVDALVG